MLQISCDAAGGRDVVIGRGVDVRVEVLTSKLKHSERVPHGRGRAKAKRPKAESRRQRAIIFFMHSIVGLFSLIAIGARPALRALRRLAALPQSINFVSGCGL